MPETPLTRAQISTHRQLMTSVPFFCKHLLKIQDKSGALVPFELNQAQLYIHNKIEQQLKTTGKVRVLILKGRQQGCSTYIAARFYHKAIYKKGQNIFILSHEGQTTDKLFKIVERYYSNTPVSARPSAEVSNRRNLIFGNGLNSQYYVGTAGNKDVGRGGTLQLFHGSEVSAWPNTDDITTGIMQSVSDLDNTEIVLESTAKGLGNYFYNQCIEAIEGRSEYELIFVPWFWQPEYRKKVQDDVTYLQGEHELKELYGLDDEQILWRRTKIASLGSEWKFKQEYPCNVNEAFQSSGKSLFDPEKIMAARKCTYKEDPQLPLVMGVDPAEQGDRTVICFRRGRQLLKYFIFQEMKPMRLAGIVARYIDSYKPAAVFVDAGYGTGTIDRLHELGYAGKVIGVYFGEAALANDLYLNKRVEMIISASDWINEPVCNIPDEDDLHADLMAMPEYEETSNYLKKLVPKKKIKEVFGKSTDILDALALTFAYPINHLRSGSTFKKATNSESKFIKKKQKERSGASAYIA